MKHYRIVVHAESHQFEFRCNTISEAYDAVQDASIAFRIDIDLNTIMVDLVKMNAGEKVSTDWIGLRVSIENGEV